MGQTGEDAILTQLALIQNKSGAKPETIAEAVDFQKSLFAVIKSAPDDNLTEGKMNEKRRKEFAQIEADVKAKGIQTIYFLNALSHAAPVLTSKGRRRYGLQAQPRAESHIRDVIIATPVLN